jgi:hypothetical protein
MLPAFLDMHLVLIIFLVDSALVLGFMLFRARRNKRRPDVDYFNFDKYKERELSKRGIFLHDRYR